MTVNKKKNGSRGLYKLVILCTLLIIAAIAVSTYMVLRENMPIVCTNDIHVVEVDRIHSLPQGSEVLCEDGVEVIHLHCDGCHTWLEGYGTCAYKSETCSKGGI